MFSRCAFYEHLSDTHPLARVAMYKCSKTCPNCGHALCWAHMRNLYTTGVLHTTRPAIAMDRVSPGPDPNGPPPPSPRPTSLRLAVYGRESDLQRHERHRFGLHGHRCSWGGSCLLSSISTGFPALVNGKSHPQYQGDSRRTR